MKKNSLLKITIIEGDDKGKFAEIKAGTCKVISRIMDEDENIDENVTYLDRSKLNVKFHSQEVKKINQFLSGSKESNDTKEIKNPFRRTSDLILMDNNISRIHAMIFYSGTNAGIIDMASTNGTYVNGKRVDMIELTNGMKIKLGNTVFEVEVVDN